MIKNHEIIKLNHAWLRPLKITDSTELFKIFSDHETMKYWSHAPHQKEEHTREMIESKHLDSGETISKFTWAITRPQNLDKCIGWLSHFKLNHGMMNYIHLSLTL